MTTGNLGLDILIVYLPILLVIVMGVLGLIRGTQREAVVSLSIVLAALILMVWDGQGGSWATDVHNAFTNFSRLDIHLTLSFLIMALVVLVIGYGLGSAVIATSRLSSLSRIGGVLLGVINGAAIGGWLLRNHVLFLTALPQGDATSDTANTLSTLQNNSISLYLILFAGWFPLAVALAAAIIALVGPFRRTRTIVATPSPQTNWVPAIAPSAVPTLGAAGAAGAYTSQYAQQQYPQPQQGQPQQQYGQPYSQSQQSQPYTPQYPAASVPGPAASSISGSTVYAPAGTPPGGYAPSSNPVSARVQPEPPTMPMAASDMPRPGIGGQDTLYIGSSPSIAPNPPNSPMPSGMTSSTTQSGILRGAPDTGPLHGEPPSVDSSLITRSEALTQAQPILPSASSSYMSTPGMTNCPRCGALVPGDAAFCTECGNRMKS